MSGIVGKVGIGLCWAAALGCTSTPGEPQRKPTTDQERRAEPDHTRDGPAPSWLRATAPVADAVVIVSIDGFAPRLVEPLIHAGRLPALARLRREGLWTHNARADPGDTRTLPNHTGMLTGRPAYPSPGMPQALHHGYTFNPNDTSGQDVHSWGNEALAYVPSVFDVVHDHGLRTGLFAGKPKFGLFVRSYDDQHGAPDADGPDDGRNKIDVAVLTEDTEALVGEFVAAMIRDPVGLSMLHIRDPDDAGHAHRWESAQWQAAAIATDRQLMRVLDAVHAHPQWGRVRVIVTSDHGGAGVDHSDPKDPDNYVVPMYIWGAGIPEGGDLYDTLGASRSDPGAEWVEVGATPGPLRNTDAANLALRWLGLVPLDVRPLVPAELDAPGGADAGSSGLPATE